MNVLAFDTCFSACSAAAGVVQPGALATVRASEHLLLDTGHAELIVPMIQRVLAEAGWTMADVERMIVTRGPGTFTGIRTGIAVARALALAAPVALVGVSSLWAVGIAALERARARTSEIGGALAVMDARKGMVYAQVIGVDGREVTAPSLIEPTAAAVLSPDLHLVVAGTAASIVAEAGRVVGRQLEVETTGDFASEVPNAVHFLSAAHQKPCHGALQPLYLRPPDAKPQSGKALPWSPT